MQVTNHSRVLSTRPARGQGFEYKYEYSRAQLFEVSSKRPTYASTRADTGVDRSKLQRALMSQAAYSALLHYKVTAKARTQAR
jgi:hypothetical protein